MNAKRHITTLTLTLAIAALTFATAVRAQEYPFEVAVTGEGKPVLLLPGFTCTKEVWEETVEKLSKNYQCHTFTFAGFGHVAPVAFPWLPKIKEGLAQYIQENKLQHCSIIGHSLGGTLALWLAAEDNLPIDKLIVVDALPATGALMMPNYKSENMVYDSPYNKRVLEMDQDGFEAMANQFVSSMTLVEERKQQLKEWILQTDRATYVYGYTDLLKLDLREALAKIQVPVSILAATYPYGEEMATNTYQTQYKNLKEYTLKFAEESAHFIMYDQPEWFINTVASELK